MSYVAWWRMMRSNLSFGPSLLSAACVSLWVSSAQAQAPATTPQPQGMAPPALSAPPARASVGRDSRSLPDPDPRPRKTGDKKFGAMLDLGLPDGTMASFVFRPISLVRLQAGLGYNAISPGFRIGGTLLPFGAGPSVSLEYGHYFEGDANGLAGTLTGTNEADSVLLERFGYDFVNLRVGMEFGGESFIFFTRGGVSWVRTTIHEFGTLLDPGDDGAAANTQIDVPQDPILSAFMPSFQLGFIIRL